MNKYKNIVINVPLTYPFEGIRHRENIVMVADWASPQQTIYPTKLKSMYHEYLIDPPHDWMGLGGDTEEYSRVVKEYTETRLNLYYDLLEKEEWNFYFIVFSEVDWFLHICPQILDGRDIRIVKPTFKLISNFISKVQEIADVTFIVSDHGFEKKHKIIYVNEILKKNGFIDYSKIKSKIVNIARKLPGKLLKKFINFLKIQPSGLAYETNLSKNKAFMIEPATWGIYVIDKRSESISRIKNIFENLPEIERVVLADDAFQGPHSKCMPSILLIPKNGVTFSHKLMGEIKRNCDIGDHEIHGIFCVSGDYIQENAYFTRTPRVYDIAPTILHIFGLPIPNDMDGGVLMEIFEPNSEFAKREPKYVDPSYYGIKQEDEKLKKVIKNLKLKGKI